MFLILVTVRSRRPVAPSSNRLEVCVTDQAGYTYLQPAMTRLKLGGASVFLFCTLVTNWAWLEVGLCMTVGGMTVLSLSGLGGAFKSARPSTPVCC